jgi:acetyl-CoA carboxylase carboxyltransferase component
LLPRERLWLLLDPGTPFLELSALAGLGLDHAGLDKSVPSGGVIAGIGIVSGVRCVINASDSGIDAGALQPMGLDKQLRVQELVQPLHDRVARLGVFGVRISLARRASAARTVRLRAAASNCSLSVSVRFIFPMHRI